MPRSVIVAVVSLGCIVGLQALAGVVGKAPNPVRAVVPLAVSGLLLAGMVKGHRLAWQGTLPAVRGRGRVGALAGLNSLTGRRAGAAIVGAVVGFGAAIAFLAIPLALRRPSAAIHFRLICPACQTRTTKADDLFFSKTRCLRCRNLW